jgi:hypothetical protein
MLTRFYDRNYSYFNLTEFIINTLTLVEFITVTLYMTVNANYNGIIIMDNSIFPFNNIACVLDSA